MRNLLITFPTTHQAMAAEDALRDAGVRLEVVPAPPQLVKGCGLAIRFHADNRGRVEVILSESGVRWSGIHET